MRRTLVSLAALALCMGMATVSFAQDGSHDGYRHERMPRARHRQVMQERRIVQGERSGQLTPRETARLEHGQARIERMKERARMDGHVTAAERARVARAQNLQSKRIWQLKHNHRHAS